jgi:hypothetical protein
LTRIFLLILNNLKNLSNKVATVGSRAGTATWSFLKEKPTVQYGFLLLGGVLLVTGGVALFTWMADSGRITQMPEKSGGGTVPQEEVASTVQQGEPPSEIVESSGTPVATTGAPSTVIETGVAIANADESSAQGSSAQGSSAQAGCAAGVPPEATAGGVVPEAECIKPALPLPAPTPAPPPPSPAKALPPAGGVDIASLLGVGTGTLLVGIGLLARRFTR